MQKIWIFEDDEEVFMVQREDQMIVVLIFIKERFISYFLEMDLVIGTNLVVIENLL